MIVQATAVYRAHAVYNTRHCNETFDNETIGQCVVEAVQRLQGQLTEPTKDGKLQTIKTDDITILVRLTQE